MSVGHNAVMAPAGGGAVGFWPGPDRGGGGGGGLASEKEERGGALYYMNVSTTAPGIKSRTQTHHDVSVYSVYTVSDKRLRHGGSGYETTRYLPMRL